MNFSKSFQKVCAELISANSTLKKIENAKEISAKCLKNREEISAKILQKILFKYGINLCE